MPVAQNLRGAKKKFGISSTAPQSRNQSCAMAILAMTGRRRDSDESGQAARAEAL
jgi:hypothetical protein